MRVKQNKKQIQDTISNLSKELNINIDEFQNYDEFKKTKVQYTFDYKWRYCIL